MTSFPQLKPVAVDRLVAGAASVVATTLNTITARVKNIVSVLAPAVNLPMCQMLETIYLFGDRKLASERKRRGVNKDYYQDETGLVAKR